MIAADHQGKGYGRAAMLLAIQLIRGQPGCSSISLSFEPENSNAERLYSSLGFKPTGEILEGEIVYRLDF
jgi:diamine N-acetyltransferase